MSEYSFDQERIMEGVEIIETLDELNTAYDSFLQLKNHRTEREAEEHKEYIEDIVDDLSTGPEESPYDNLMENLDTAFESAIRFNRSVEEDRLEIKEENQEVYNLLVQAGPSKVSLDEPRLMERFQPNSGALYDLTRSIIHEGPDYLDKWAEKIDEQEEKAEPATRPEEREDTAERMYR